MLLAKPEPQNRFRLRLRPADVVLVLGAAILMLPSLVEVAQFNWTTEQGGHGPIVLATGLWLLWRELSSSEARREPGNLALGALLVGALLTIYVVARITGILEIEALAMYGALIAGAYLVVGKQVLKSIWFPLVYLALALPPPNSVVAVVTQPIKIAISSAAVEPPARVRLSDRKFRV